MGGNSKNSTLFISLLKRLKATYLRAKIIPLWTITSRETQPWLKENPKFRGIYQPVYSPWVNHVEQLWQAFHDTITCNHQSLNVATIEKSSPFYGNRQPIPRRQHGLAKV
ncbi:hypothetical protein JNE112863_44930 (plasmid) [Escherichia coli]